MQIVYVYVPDWPTGVYVFFRSNLEAFVSNAMYDFVEQYICV